MALNMPLYSDAPLQAVGSHEVQASVPAATSVVMNAVKAEASSEKVPPVTTSSTYPEHDVEAASQPSWTITPATASGEDAESANHNKRTTARRTILLNTLLFLAALTIIWTSTALPYLLILCVSRLFGEPSGSFEKYLPFLVLGVEIFITLSFCSRTYTNWSDGRPGGERSESRDRSFRESVWDALLVFMSGFALVLAVTVILLGGVCVAKACGLV